MKDDMIEQPLFNSIDYGDEYRDPQGGTLMGLYYIKDMKPIRKGNRRIVQMCDCGFRATNANAEISKHWNQCQYEDIDYKNWIHYCKKYLKDESKLIKPEIVYVNVINKIIKNWPETLYYYEVSRHGEGFHFIFYFNIERNKENWNKTKNISHAIVKQAFIDCGYEEIINFDGVKDENGNKLVNKVFDGCTDAWNQLLYLTMKKACINSLCTGEVKEYPDIEIVDYKPKKVKYVNNGDEYIISVEKTELKEGEYVDYIDHIQRWHLYNGLKRCYQDDFMDEWLYCCEHMRQGPNNHTTEWYKSLDEGSTWDKDFEDDCYVDSKLLKMFGYEVTFTKKSMNKAANKELKDCYKNILGLDI